MSEDPRKTAARLQYQRRSPASRADPEEAAQRSQVASLPGDQLRTAVVEGALQEAIRRGDFDNLPGFGKPLTGLDKADDPDWWIRDKIEKENLTGLAPPALALRKEDLELDDRLDELTTEKQVRAHLEDFNHRIVQARFQPQGGPPVITQPRDVDAGVAAWRKRREKAAAAAKRDAGEVVAGQAAPSRAAASGKRKRRGVLARLRGK